MECTNTDKKNPSQSSPVTPLKKDVHLSCLSPLMITAISVIAIATLTGLSLLLVPTMYFPSKLKNIVAICLLASGCLFSIFLSFFIYEKRYVIKQLTDKQRNNIPVNN